MGFLLETGFHEETNLIFRLFTSQIALMSELLETLEKPHRARQLKENVCEGSHRERILGIRDAMDVLSGKWKIQIIGTLLFGGRMRFMDLIREVDGIAAKMLSKELQDLETHQLITRTVMETKPITVEYEITPYGRSLEKVIIEIVHWGYEHRTEMMR
jgi:DNA-binding HxlR family transcriptional regulator